MGVFTTLLGLTLAKIINFKQSLTASLEKNRKSDILSL